MVRVRVGIMVYVKPFCSAEKPKKLKKRDNFWASELERAVEMLQEERSWEEATTTGLDNNQNQGVEMLQQEKWCEEVATTDFFMIHIRGAEIFETPTNDTENPA